MNKYQVPPFSPSPFLALSIIGLVLIPIMIMQPNLGGEQLDGQRILIGALFSAVCVFGVVAVFYPASCRSVFRHDPGLPTRAKTPSSDVRIVGHHPSCKNFSGNRIAVGGRVFCAACSGLLVGATLALIGGFVYFFFGFNFNWDSMWPVYLGEICMLAGLAQFRVAGVLKLTLNAVFVIGSFVTLAGVDAVRKSLYLDLYVLGLILFFLWFRISLSEWNNRRICRDCQLCSY